MSGRRIFIRQSLLGAGGLLLAPNLSMELPKKSEIKISLAEWSLNRALYSGKLDHLDFSAKARNDFGISVVEYVNGFFGGTKMNFKEAGKNLAYLKELLKRSTDAGVVNHLIMIDDEGALAATGEKERLQAIDDHKKWVEAAKFLGCLTVRVNLKGEGSSEEKKSASVDSLGRLGDFARTMQINVVVENHGGDSSRGVWMADVMNQVNRSNVGTLPDFGNFCVSDPWGTTQGDCTEKYDPYQGLKEMMPFAKGVSAKTYDFDDKGEQPKMDYKRLIDIVKASGYKGYIGIEFEGENQPEEEGIRKTRLLIEKYL
jgi:sugar phosphate isomerase/epimerase